MRPNSPRTRTWLNSPSITRLIAPDRSETENSGAFSPGSGSSIRSDMWSAPCVCVPVTLERAAIEAKQELPGMNILILGSGGREHALAWAVLQNPKCDRLIVAPGNGGISEIAECASLDILDGGAVAGFCEAEAVDFIII